MEENFTQDYCCREVRLNRTSLKQKARGISGVALGGLGLVNGMCQPQGVILEFANVFLCN